MPPKAIQLDPRDNVLVALTDLPAGERIHQSGEAYSLTMTIPAKHKFAGEDFAAGAEIRMYGVTVGRAHEPIARGGLLTTANVVHDAAGFASQNAEYRWVAPDVTRWTERTFAGYPRADGQVGTRNYWLVVPLVFCENRNVDALREAFEEELGYGRPKQYREQVRALLQNYREAGTVNAADTGDAGADRVFPNVDGIKFLVHQGGCGGTRDDSRALCGLLAGYIHHPNVAGATVLSLGCQNAQVSDLFDELKAARARAQQACFGL
jgi:altronate hydrolase